MTAAEILRLIETVDPADTGKLDEIDARVWCMLMDYEFIDQNYNHSGDTWNIKYKLDHVYSRDFDCFDVKPRYTRSRDALKGIRPDGWDTLVSFNHKRNCGYATYNLWKDDGHENDLQIDTPQLPTEELAELHAIIQCIEHEGGGK